MPKLTKSQIEYLKHRLDEIRQAALATYGRTYWPLARLVNPHTLTEDEMLQQIASGRATLIARDAYMTLAEGFEFEHSDDHKAWDKKQADQIARRTALIEALDKAANIVLDRVHLAGLDPLKAIEEFKSCINSTAFDGKPIA